MNKYTPSDIEKSGKTFGMNMNPLYVKIIQTRKSFMPL